ncbi:hypothetical protein LTR62_003353 [Meristemomyces frigidus]|uniref:Uncharacterized protein n=1 Tax=Meristemomyces frigidus TaxID=1508187 RepID=A0AAN7TIQ5_9PEZI|nr:hypothetical protein LTR62_003353 [Meristemomyces frigidus]
MTITIKHLVVIAIWSLTFAVYYLGWQTYKADLLVASTPNDVLSRVQTHWYDLSHEAQNAVKNIKNEVDKIDLSAARKDLDLIDEDLKHAIGLINVPELEK